MGGGGTGSDAFGHFYHRHANDIYGYFLRRTSHRELSHDLTADTFVAALEGVETFDPERGNPRQWLYGIAGNLVRRAWRRNETQRMALRRLESTVSAASTAGYDAAEARADAIRLTEALERVPADKRIALYLRIVEQLGYDEIRQLLDCSPEAEIGRAHV